MHILIVGASGFVGRHVMGRLAAAGVNVTAASRSPERLARAVPGVSTLRCDLSVDGAAAWYPRLAGVDAVVNCAGLFGDDRGYAAVHANGPAALFDACRATGVSRVIQVSALGADRDATTAYHRSKAAADAHLAALDPAGETMGWAILRPSIVIGRGGQSSALFTALAALPVTPDLGPADGMVQPIHVDDLVEIIVRLLRNPLPLAISLDAVGPEAMTTGVLTATVRRWLGLPPALRVSMPQFALGAVARLGIGPVTREGMTMLVAGNTAPVEPMRMLTGHAPLPINQALARHPASSSDLRDGRLASVAPVLRLALALVWLAGGMVPLMFTPAVTSAAWLARVGLSGTMASAALWAGALADIAIGIGLFLRVRGTALVGVALMTAYTLILTGMAPELWADPFGALVKNVAVFALSLAVHALEPRHG